MSCWACVAEENGYPGEIHYPPDDGRFPPCPEHLDVTQVALYREGRQVQATSFAIHRAPKPRCGICAFFQAHGGDPGSMVHSMETRTVEERERAPDPKVWSPT